MNDEKPPGGLLSAEDRADIQGFVTSGYGHLPHALYLFVHFQKAASARNWLRRLLPDVTTARSWRRAPGQPKEKPSQTTNVALTAAGLTVLGLPVASAASFPPEFREGIHSEERARILGDAGDSASANWQVGGPRQPSLHALLIHLADSPELVRRRAEQWRREWEEDGAGLVVAEEFGVLPAHGREHFGFRDGIAQPVIAGIKGHGIRTGEFILGYENEYGYHPVSPWLPADDDPSRLLPHSPNPYQSARRDFGRNGTFLVYRKLEQNVAGFWQFLEEESQRRHGRAEPRFMVWLASKMVGRWPGGAPLTLSPDLDDPALSLADDFEYAASDGDGLRCPFGAHIRRTNPRDQLGPARAEESRHMTVRHLLLRRGRVYGEPLFPPDLLQRMDAWGPEELRALLEDDGRPRGVHFLCVNASIKSQFEFVQQVWVNNPQFNGLSGNPDPLMGGPEGPGMMHVPGPEFDLRTASMPRWVTVRGGGYFFMPGLKALRWLAAA